MLHRVIITYVPGVINSLMLKKDPVCIPYGFAKLGFRSLLVCDRALIRVPAVEIYELGLFSPRRGPIPFYIYNALNSIAIAFYHGIKLARLVAKERPWFVLIYYSPAIIPLLYILSRVLGFRLVVKMDWDGVIRGGRVKRFIRRLSLFFFLRFADLVIIESFESFLNAVKSVPHLYHKLRVVYNGWCREILGGGLNDLREKIVLTVARIEPVKGIHDLIKAFSRITDKHRDWVLRIVGPITNKDYFDSVKKLVDELDLAGRVVFVGAISDSELVHQYRRASIFVLPSYIESFAIARIEALAFGLPIITTKTGGSEIVRGVGIIVEPGDVDSLAQALDKLMSDEDLRKELSRKAWKRAQSLTWEAICGKIIENVMKALPR